MICICSLHGPEIDYRGSVRFFQKEKICWFFFLGHRNLSFPGPFLTSKIGRGFDLCKIDSATKNWCAREAIADLTFFCFILPLQSNCLSLFSSTGYRGGIQQSPKNHENMYFT